MCTYCTYRKMHICRIWSAALIALVCMAVLSLPAFAADAVTAVIPVSVESDDLKESYQFQLTALNGADENHRKNQDVGEAVKDNAGINTFFIIIRNSYRFGVTV